MAQKSATSGKGFSAPLGLAHGQQNAQPVSKPLGGAASG